MANEELTLTTLAQSWLAQQCQSVASIARGVVVLGALDHASLVPTAVWPSGAEATPGLTAAAKLAIGRKCPVVHGNPVGEDPDAPGAAVACPILLDTKLFGVVAVELESGDEQQKRAVMQLLQWGCSWLEFLVRRETSAVTNQLMTVLELVAMVLEHEHFKAAATEAATDLASRMRCDRVSLGFLAGRHMRVQALSHSAEFGKKTTLVRDIGVAMDEALDQDDIIVYPSRAMSPRGSPRRTEISPGDKARMPSAPSLSPMLDKSSGWRCWNGQSRSSTSPPSSSVRRSLP